MIFSKEQLSLFDIVNQHAKAKGVRVYIVGGMIRDIFLGHDPEDKDVDFIVEGNAIDFASECINKTGGELKQFPDFITAKIVNLRGYGVIGEIDFASSRTEFYEAPGKLPKVAMAPISEDLKRRDFTINALAAELADILEWSSGQAARPTIQGLRVLDLYSGVEDIEKRVVRVLHPKSFEDDPTRIFRALRYTARIEGAIERATEDYLTKAIDSGFLDNISNQRRVNELKKILFEKDYGKILELFVKFGINRRLGLFDTEKLPNILLYLTSALKQTQPDQDLFYKIAIRIFYYSSQDKPEHFLGLGSNEMKRLKFDTRDDLDISQKQTLQRLSTAGKLFQAILRVK